MSVLRGDGSGCLTLSAPAKINLHLHVTATLASGYHQLDTSFAFVDICDRLQVDHCDTLEVTCSRAHLNGADNLVQQILLQFQQRYAVCQGLRIHIDKRLPEQAGLGGGSSDAATALMAANQLWGVRLSRQQLIEFATPFGADIPCFIFGRASTAGGVGDELSSYPYPLPDQTVLIAYPGVGLSTAEVFARHDCALTHQIAVDTMRAPRRGGVGCNDLQPAAISLLPELGDLLAELSRYAQLSWMSGSGSSCVALFAQRREALWCAQRLQSESLAEWVHVGGLLESHPVQMDGLFE
ncbi:MAG: 4-(cytidine 5'-diphospho)-2-C-methyl-D-erythritol kinase [Mariprofundales bacterium]|nr:4-(cytidine 5'-diphospho)-2-C-methyl-D-erythritol kinase [Mariprofundales bacterium]